MAGLGCRWWSSWWSSAVRPERRVLRFGALALAAAVTVWIIILAGGDAEMIDLAVYQWAGDVASEPGRLYQEAWRDWLPFLYPPVTVVLFMPLVVMPFPVLQVASFVAALLAVIVAVDRSWGAVGQDPGARRLGLTLGATALALTVLPVSETIRFGQINLVVLALVLVDLCLPDTNRWKGVGVGLAAGTKLTALFFVPYLVLTGRKVAAVRVLAVFALTVAVGFALLPTDSHEYWVGGVFADTSRVGADFVSNQSINGVLLRLSGGENLGALRVVFAGVVGALGLAVSVRLSRRRQELAAITVCGLTSLLVSPISWWHHWVWVVPAVVVGIDAALRDRRWIGALALGTIVFVAVPFHTGAIWQVPHRDGAGLGWTLFETFGSNVYVWVGLLSLVGAGVGLRRDRTVRADEPVPASRPAIAPSGEVGAWTALARSSSVD